MEWISVENQLPPCAGVYLVFVNWGDDDYSYELERYTKKTKWENFGDVITHWMELPNPPQK